MAENNLNLYGAPYISSETALSVTAQKYISSLEERNTGVLTYDDKKDRDILSFIPNHIEKLRNTSKQQATQMKQIANKIKAQTIEMVRPFTVEEYLNKLNEAESEFDDLLLNWVTKTVNVAADLVKTQGLDINDINTQQAVFQNKKVNNLLDNLSEKIASLYDYKNPDIVKNALKDVVVKDFFNKSTRQIAFDTASSGRSGAIGELATRIGTPIAQRVGGLIDDKVKDIAADLSGASSKGAQGGKIDTESFGITISVKNYYKSIKDKILTDEQIGIGVQSTVQPHNLIQYIEDHVDGSLKVDDTMLDTFNTYWMNMMYLYSYGITQPARDVRSELNALISCYGATYLSLGSKDINISSRVRTYRGTFDNILKTYGSDSNGRLKPALFIDFTHYGLIPMYEVLEALALGAAVGGDNQAKLEMKYSSAEASRIVDKDFGTNLNDGIPSGTNIYYGSLNNEGVDQPSEVENLLRRRYEKFTANLGRIQVKLVTDGKSLSDLIARYGGMK